MKSGTACYEAAPTVALPNLDSIIRGILYVYIFSLPFQALLFIERNGFVIILVLLALWSGVNRRLFFVRTPVDLPLLAFVTWVGITVPVAAFPAYSVREFGKLLQHAIIFYAVVYFFRSSPSRVRLLWDLEGALSLVSAYGIIQFLKMVDVLPWHHDLLVIESVTSGEVWLTTYLVLVIPLCFAVWLFEKRPAPKFISGVAALLGTVCLLLTFSRAGLLALICQSALFVWVSKPKLLLPFLMAVILVLSTLASILLYYGANNIPGTSIPIRGVSSSSLMHRIDIWKFSLGKVLEHPFTGLGYGKDNFRLVFSQLAEEVRPGQAPVLNAGTHNTFLDIALGVGLPGLLIFLWLLYRIVVITWSEFRLTDIPFDKAVILGVVVSVVGLIIRLFFDHMLVGTLGLIFWVLVGMAMGVSRGHANIEKAALPH